MHLWTRAKETFGVRPAASAGMDAFIRRCADIYGGRPDWADPDKDIRTVNFAKTVCSETARLAMLGTKITIGGDSQRAAWLQEQVDALYPRLREWTEKGCALGTVILKPNGEGVELLTPEQFEAVDVFGDAITGAVFVSRAYEATTERWYTRLEYHRFTENGTYEISNRCFLGHSERDPGKAVPIEATPWAGLDQDAAVQGLDRPLFAVLRMPGGNNIDGGSALGMPVFADALEELKDLDVAYSRMTGEVYDSARIELIDDRLLDTPGSRTGKPDAVKLPRQVRKVSGFGPEEYYQEIDPEIRTDARMVGINALLSQIGFKCGFSNGYFVFNEKSGTPTATQVESYDRRTIQHVKDVRDKLEGAMEGLLYALDKWADLYDLAPVGQWDVTFDFGDLTYNREEDRARWMSYVTQGWAPAWYLLQRFEGFSEEEAKDLAEAAKTESVIDSPQTL